MTNSRSTFPKFHVTFAVYVATMVSTCASIILIPLNFRETNLEEE